MSTCDTFPKFTELPRELRDIVWTHALHPDPGFSNTVRSVHHIRLRQKTPCPPVSSKVGRTLGQTCKYAISPSPTLMSTTQPSRALLSACHESRYLVLKELPETIRFPDLGDSSFRFHKLRDQVVLILSDSEVLHEFRSSLHEFPLEDQPSHLEAMGFPPQTPRMGVMYQTTRVSVIGDQLTIPPKLLAQLRNDPRIHRDFNMKLPIHWREVAVETCPGTCKRTAEIKLFEEAVEAWCLPYMMALFAAMEDYDLNLGQKFPADAMVTRFVCPDCGSEGEARRVMELDNQVR